MRGGGEASRLRPSRGVLLLHTKGDTMSKTWVLGQNIAATLLDDGQTLSLVIDLSKRGGRSASGKSVTVATTSGNRTIPGSEVVIGINAYVKG